ncbi:DegV family protein [Caldisalinibacter kiritimatiensis]|uniref:DegV family protein n=1 Tax=Caldisalinibacter kiritimatiensis TaxID=1304284 RepID=R1CRY9_9FIRM|nr:DegV family protein [Caldisalinibacter kiritimatiensis]EOC99463.1 DegV family protein [Caldisalinibacter kiritimatiensis]
MKIKIVADSSCDLNEKLSEKLNIDLVPLNIRIGDENYIDDENLDLRTLLNKMNNSRLAPQTSSPSPQAFIEKFKEKEKVFVVTLSSALSSTYNNAVLAKSMILEEVENKFVHVFDSLSASVGETLVCMKISELAENNLNELEIVEKVNKYIKDMKTFFVLESLENLIKAGRMSRLKGHIASALSIKPIMGGNDEGKIKLVDKVRGSKRALRRLVEIIGEQGERLEEKVLGIAHCNCLEKAQKVKEKVEEKYNFKDIVIVEMSGLSSVYANEGGIVIAF